MTGNIKKTYVKHFVECNCILPQFSRRVPVVFHYFVVFSVIETDGSLVPSFAQCTNCSAIHHVTEAGVSHQLHKEEMRSLPTPEEIKTHLPEGIGKILDSYKCDLPTWQETSFIFENELWGKTVLLYKEEADGMIAGKFLIIMSKDLWKIDGFQKAEDVVK